VIAAMVSGGADRRKRAARRRWRMGGSHGGGRKRRSPRTCEPCRGFSRDTLGLSTIATIAMSQPARDHPAASLLCQFEDGIASPMPKAEIALGTEP